MSAPHMQLLAIATLASVSVACGSSALPRVSEVTCSTLSIPCGDDGKTAILCRGSALGVTGTVTYTWQCFHAGAGNPICTYTSPAAEKQQCKRTGDEFQCTGPADSAAVELRCTGRAREQCSLIVAVGDLVSDPRVNQGRFVISVSPACPGEDGGVPDGGSLDGASPDAGN